MNFQHFVNIFTQSPSFQALNDWLQINTGDSIHDRLPELIEALETPDCFDELLTDYGYLFPPLPDSAVIGEVAEDDNAVPLVMVAFFYVGWWRPMSFANQLTTILGTTVHHNQVHHGYLALVEGDAKRVCFQEDYVEGGIQCTYMVPGKIGDDEGRVYKPC